MTPEKALELIVKFENSEGWNYVQDVMRDEVLRAAYALAEDDNPSYEQIQFRRGAMWAARRLLELPTRLRQNLESELIIKKSQEIQ
ncbi:MAG: hypothetical protein VW443_00505 [Pseudomonadales bacterium]